MEKMEVHLNLLHGMRLSGGIFLEADFTAPWCVGARVTADDCAPFAPVPRHIIAYHYVSAGRMFLSLEGEAPVVVDRGEIVVLPRNDPHSIGSLPGLEPVTADDLIQTTPEGRLARIVYGGGGEPTQILCGFLGNDMPRNALISMLPRVLKLNVMDGASGEWIESTLKFAARELACGDVQSPAIIARLAEILFIEAVRRYLASLSSRQGNQLAGAKDPLVARALGLLHEQVSRRWTTEELAKQVGLSRSAFADHFTRAVGEPPMRYITRLRLELAASRLAESSDSIARIGFDIGYESEAAFNRAFKREYGVPPATWRRNKTTVTE